MGYKIVSIFGGHVQRRFSGDAAAVICCAHFPGMTLRINGTSAVPGVAAGLRFLYLLIIA